MNFLDYSTIHVTSMHNCNVNRESNKLELKERYAYKEQSSL